MSARIDVLLSRRVIDAMLHPPEHQHCFRNAQLALWAAVPKVTGPNGDWKDWMYVEGCVQPAGRSGLPPCDIVGHAWLETRDGRVVDLTEVFLDAPDLQAYHAINRWSREEVVKNVRERTGPGGFVQWMLSPEEVSP